MADSDNSTTLPFVIKRWRRRRGIVAVDAASSFAICLPQNAFPVDAAVELLREWNETHHAAGVLCRLQQRQESRLLKLKSRMGNADDLHTEARSHEATRSAELDALDTEEQLLAACITISATSLAGVLAKLEIINSAGQGRGSAVEFPWPQIRSVTEDLRRLLTDNGAAAMSA